MQSRHLRHGYSGRGAQLPTLIGSALADIAIRPHGHRSARPHGLAHGADARRKPWFLPVVGAYCRMKDTIAGSCRGPRTAAE